MRISDWSSDVCSSDLAIGARVKARRPASRPRVELGDQVETVAAKQLPAVGDDAPGAPGRAVEFETGGARIHAQPACPLSPRRPRAEDRASVVSGKRVSVRVFLGGGRLI